MRKFHRVENEFGRSDKFKNLRKDTIENMYVSTEMENRVQLKSCDKFRKSVELEFARFAMKVFTSVRGWCAREVSYPAHNCSENLCKWQH